MDKRAKIFNFIKGVRYLKRSLLQILILSIIVQFLNIISPYYVQIVVDEAVTTKDTDLLVILAIGFAFVSIFNSISMYIRSLCITIFGARISETLSKNVIRILLNLPLEYYNGKHVGDIVSRFGSLKNVNKIISKTIVEACIDILMVVTTLIVLLIYNYKLSLVVIIGILAYLMIRLAWYRPLRIQAKSNLEVSALENSNFMENIRAIHSIKYYSMIDNRERTWLSYYIDSLSGNVKLQNMQSSFSLSKNILFGLEGVIVIYLGAIFVIESNSINNFTIGMLIAFMAYKSQLTSHSSSLIDKFIEYKMLGMHLERLGEITETETENTGGSFTNLEIKGCIELSRVSYKYNESPIQLLDDISVRIKQGESVAIVGKSGSGKTTIMNLIIGSVQPQQGSIEIDNVDLKTINISKYREQIAVVMQTDQLLKGTIAENISCFDSTVDMDLVNHCADVASVSNDINSFKDGYSTYIGELGNTLSSGQRQRILIARALYKRPKIIIMDEATSHLDISTEKTISSNIKKLNITRVIVAHRKETIMSADRIYELSNGKLMEIKNYT
ncbi:peptidase domain-containing ABC transporter [Vibrio sp. CUB2]|uniref:peptidase domain-containing ABC transporter n=1 Tax=Vibrio sp. CUB2 TaxID=2315233 RepID=UPI00076A9D11|nr:peptidase domain-containing ABC transporter [Vibrio sp. CUB2]